MPSLTRVLLLIACLTPLALAQSPGPATPRDRTRNPHGPLAISCEACHTATAWKPIRPKPEFNHNTQTAYPLRGMHADVACQECHTSPVFKRTPTDCASCHADLHRAQMGNHCEDCHTVRGWTPAAQFTRREHTNRFPLLGAHARVECESCHRGAANGVYVGLSTDCATCHRSDFAATQNPPHQAAGFPLDCSVCHSMNGWLNAKFDHATYAHFPLTGVHATLACASCHVGGRFTGTPTACVNCHQADLQSATNPNHTAAGFSTDCSLCHNTTTWLNATFDHTAATGFALTGAHATVACSQCHTGNSYATAPRTCDGCHLTDFNNTTNPNHAKGGFPTDCSLCHSTVSWAGATFDHSKSSFPLTGAHVAVQCAQCHVNNNYNTIPTNCDGCHLADYNKTTDPNHVQAGFPTTCELCHNTTSWSGSTFDHSKTQFPLTGAHTSVQCAQCHINNNYTTVPTTCDGCHLTDYNKTTDPNHVQAGFPTNCTLCHSTTSWSGATFDHSKTQFPLTGAHTTVQCAQCHVNNNYTTVPTNCDGCHLADFNKTTDPNHVQAAFPTNCALCHSTTSWDGATFDHSKTQFPLTGAHTTVQCAQCHVNNNYTTVPTNCDGCHLADFNKTTDPNHVSSGFPTTCATCHNTTTWSNATFDHNAASGFALTGAHATVACNLCHVNNNFTTVPRTCDGCHLSDYNKTTDPNHAKAGFPTDCSLCHSTVSWSGATFDHSKTVFPLTGAHTTVLCAQCHVNNNYTTVPTNCDACHLTDYNQTTSPNHSQVGFPLNCSLCHSTTNWTSATFDHSKTAFPLTGAHTTVACAQCHIGNNYTTVPTDCYSCHKTDYTGVQNPNHATSGFPTTCTLCHNTTSWAGATFDHNAVSGFALTGAHTTVACNLCHVGTDMSTAPRTCNGCHMADYNKTTDPNHTQVGFPTDCSLCHTTATWSNATFDHSKTVFPLTGAHTSVACAQCHVNNNYTTVVTACSGCHIKEYNQTTNPNHAQAGFPQDCSLCHSTTNWTSATFDHSKTSFPLTGAHTTVPCASCHVGNNYTTVPTDCYSCHKTDYTGVQNPNHVTANFPTTCLTCHNTTTWAGATFNHTWFPIYSGTHARVWTTCADCHLDASNYNSFSCTNCHTHSQANTDPEHRNVRGYTYTPTSCYQCHPSGRAD